MAPDGKFVLDGQGLYNLALHKSYGAHSVIINVSGKGFQHDCVSRSVRRQVSPTVKGASKISNDSLGKDLAPDAKFVLVVSGWWW
ncbi:MAG: hypothetical protein WBZ36_01515 [Candidatus Nitrosopolaris sp.]